MHAHENGHNMPGAKLPRRAGRTCGVLLVACLCASCGKLKPTDNKPSPPPPSDSIPQAPAPDNRIKSLPGDKESPPSPVPAEKPVRPPAEKPEIK